MAGPLLLMGCPTRSISFDGGGTTDTGRQADGQAAATWCGQQIAPAGQAASDYTCVDFDDGAIPSGSGWTLKSSNKGAGALTTQHASSLPYSWSASVSTVDRSVEMLDWHVTGALQVASVTVSADLNPANGIVTPWTGSVSLLCVRLGSCDACLNYTEGEDTGFSASYRGYYLSAEYSGGAVSLSRTQLYGSVVANLWTRVQMTVTAANNSVAVTLGSMGNTPVTTFFDPDTAVDVFVGPQTNGTTAGWNGDIDNVIVSVTRSK